MAAERTQSSGTPDLSGTPYRHIREIGRGGMGSVHEVEHRALGKLFVMKVLHEKLAHREDFALRMRSEWRILAKLEHPTIVQVTDAGRTSEGLPFFVMERLEGETVADALRSRGRWTPLDAARLMVRLLAGLEVAHAAGAIHRDIKPQNLFLTPRGPKILDFGIVKRKNSALLTQSGVAIGTPRYMAPEQAAGLVVDGRTDIYACALVLFEMIAGRDPYAHLSDQAALIGAQISEPAPRLDDVCLDAPAPLADLLQRWLAKVAADRPASARLARIELEALLPLLEDAGSPPISQAGLARGPNESTAGRTSDSALLPPATEPPEFGAERKTRTLSSEQPSLLAPEPPAESQGAADPPGLSPSLTPPPLTGASGVGGKTSRSRWLLASLGMASLVTLGLGALVLSPDVAGSSEVGLRADSLRPADFHFPANPVAVAAGEGERPAVEIASPRSMRPLLRTARPPPARPRSGGPRSRAGLPRVGLPRISPVQLGPAQR